MMQTFGSDWKPFFTTLCREPKVVLAQTEDLDKGQVYIVLT